MAVERPDPAVVSLDLQDCIISAGNNEGVSTWQVGSVEGERFLLGQREHN